MTGLLGPGLASGEGRGVLCPDDRVVLVGSEEVRRLREVISLRAFLYLFGGEGLGSSEGGGSRYERGVADLWGCSSWRAFVVSPLVSRARIAAPFSTGRG